MNRAFIAGVQSWSSKLELKLAEDYGWSAKLVVDFGCDD
jgi:hypothetical protein